MSKCVKTTRRLCWQAATIIATISIVSFLSPGALAGDLADESAAIEKANASWNDLSAEFIQKTHIELLEKTLTRRGKIFLKKKGKFRIEYSGKDPKNYVSDGTTLWIYCPSDGPDDTSNLQTYAADDKNMPKEALSFLDGFGKLERDFLTKNSTAFSETTKRKTALHLTPLSKKPHFKSIDALFNAQNLAEEIIINNLSGNKSHYIFKNIKTNSGLPDSLFTLSSGKATPDTLPK